MEIVYITLQQVTGLPALERLSEASWTGCISVTGAMFNSLAGTFRASPKHALFLAQVIGFSIGPVKITGVVLGNVTEQALAPTATLGWG
jgi:hypothetical protein